MTESLFELFSTTVFFQTVASFPGVYAGLTELTFSSWFGMLSIRSNRWIS
jgi:hypothetical protein